MAPRRPLEKLFVPKQTKKRRAIPQSGLQLKSRVQRSMSEGRWQQALELGKELYRQEATPTNRELLLKIYLGRARQLRNQGHTRDAYTVLQNARGLAGDSRPWFEPIAEELAMVGQVADALALIQQLPGSELQAKVLARTADAAMTASGQMALPESLQAGRDLIRQAFAQLTAGQDDALRETLQGIGLQSPFLEWKLLLRGLLAYYQNDDLRAAENWSRLNPDRIPARLAAPFRFRTDSAFRLAQPPETQAVLQRQGDRLQGSGLVPSLRAIQTALSQQELTPAFRLAEGLLPALRQEAPQHVSRLAACFYWAIIQHGVPADMNRYKKVFGTPADDPRLARLEALALEFRHDYVEAHQLWQEFQQSAAEHPAAWPAGKTNLVRALVWSHMGNNAARIDEEDQEEKPSRRRRLAPSAEECFRRALTLAPDEREPHEALFSYYHQMEEPEKAAEIGQQLLERFPDHPPTLEGLGLLYLELKRYPEGLDLLRRALRANPLNRGLRSQVSRAHTLNARALGESGRFEEARAEFQAALASWEDKDRTMPLCKWAACEFKAENAARAEELLAEAWTYPDRSLASAFLMVMEAVRFKLARPLKTRFDREFKVALAAPPTAEEAIAALSTAASHRTAGITYRGQKAHEKQLLDYLGRVSKTAFNEIQLESTCAVLLALKDVTAARKFTELGCKRFPRNPHYPYFEAQTYLLSPKRRSAPWQASSLLMEAERLAQALPPDDRARKLLDLIRKDREALGPMVNPFGMLENIFGHMFEDEDADDGDDW